MAEGASVIAVICCLVLTITSTIFFSAVMNDNAHDKYNDLVKNTYDLQIKINDLIIREPTIVECANNNTDSAWFLSNCSETLNTDISNNTGVLIIKEAQLDMNSVSSVNNTVVTTVMSLCDRIALLEAGILNAMTNETTTVPEIIQNGTNTISLINGQSFNFTYNLKKLIIGDLRLIYLEIPVWTQSLILNVNTVDPVIKIDNFVPSLTQAGGATVDVFKPLIRPQRLKIAWSSVNVQATSYKWTDQSNTLEIYSKGNAGALNTVGAGQEINIIFQSL